MRFSIRSMAATAAAALLSTAAVTASAVTLDFEDVPIADPAVGEALPTPYRGLTFTFLTGPRDASLPAGSWYALQDVPPFPVYAISGVKSLVTETAYVPDPGSPGDFIQDDSGAVADSQPIVGSLPFTFTGASFRALDDNVALIYKLYFGGVQVHTASTSIATFDSTTFFASGYTGLVDTVVVNGPNGYYAMDNFQFTPVPEPGTYALMLAGLGVVGWAARRRKQAQADELASQAG